MKGRIPYAAIQKCITADGQDSGYVFTCQDFADALLFGANALGWDHEQYLRACQHWGDHQRALCSLGLERVPDTAEQAYAKLAADWERRGLDTAFKVVQAYQLSDVLPLLRISQERQAFVLRNNHVAPFLDFPSVSSFAFQQMIASATRGVNAMTLYPLGPFLSQLVRDSITGGLGNDLKLFLSVL